MNDAFNNNFDAKQVGFQNQSGKRGTIPTALSMGIPSSV
jgi:hypothetical protein